jgi:hypothetical protein
VKIGLDIVIFFVALPLLVDFGWRSYRGYQCLKLFDDFLEKYFGAYVFHFFFLEVHFFLLFEGRGHVAEGGGAMAAGEGAHIVHPVEPYDGLRCSFHR